MRRLPERPLREDQPDLFGYIAINPETLSKERQNRFRTYYCGLCRTLRSRHGLVASAALSYDLTFLAVLLNALYEPGETAGSERCPTHPIRAHDFTIFAAMDYVADMNVALAYHKLRDDWLDDRNARSLAEAKLLERGYRRACEAHPDQCAAIERWLDAVHAEEARGREASIDLLANGTGEMLGALFQWKKDDPWNDDLREVGDGLGRFIYFMDAYEDLPADLRKRRFNPLREFAEQEEYETLCRGALMDMVAEATNAFERLPILLDADILRNVLYSGVWNRYGMLQRKRNPEQKGER